jgi:hypothetical protein
MPLMDDQPIFCVKELLKQVRGYDGGLIKYGRAQLCLIYEILGSNELDLPLKNTSLSAKFLELRVDYQK